MRAEKGGAKSGGFFNLFDWNRKSRKKLFSNGSPEGVKQTKRSDSDLPAAQFRLVDDDEAVGVSSVKGSSDYSCASSVTDEDGNGVRAPGVVARLMGLDTMPTTGVSEPYRTPLFDTRSLQDSHFHKRSPEFYINDQFNHVPIRGEGYTRKLTELRPQKMPSSPIERFQTEMLPPRSAKPISRAHHKLLSPIKNPSFISPRNAAHIMEAAAKMLEPGFQSGTKSKQTTFESASIPLKTRDSKNSLAVSQRMMPSARTTFETTDSRYLRGQPLNRSWNGSDNASAFRRSVEPEGNTLPSVKGKEKSVSLAIQAKVNVQRRGEGLSATSRKALDHSSHEEFKSNQPFKSQPSNQRNKPQKQPLTANASGVLRHNNQKQNCPPNKGKSAPKQSMSNQQERKAHSVEGHSGKNKAVNKSSGNFRVGYRKEGVETADLDMEGSASNNKDFPQKKRLIERGFHSDKVGFDNSLPVRHEKHVQPNVIIDEHTRWKEDEKRDGMDVVSFTFTSPLIKPMHGSGTSAQLVEIPDKRNAYSFDTSIERKSSISKDKRLSFGSNGISGDALSLLLEQKLRELTAGVELSDCSFVNSACSAASSGLTQESGTGSNAISTAGAQHEAFLRRHSSKDKSDSIVGFGVSSTNGQVFGMTHKMQGVEEVECSSSSDARKEHPEQQNPSPLSVLEASFSSESCNSSESSVGTNESKVCAAANVSSGRTNKQPEMELLDSASSENIDRGYTSNSTNPSKDDLEYIRELLQNIGDSYLTNATAPLNSLQFDKLENKRSWSSHRDDKDSRLRRKVVFDCVNECLDFRCNRYFRAGYRTWTKGVSLSRKDLAEELHQEILGWKSMGDWMVDALVDKDMSNQLGKWADFQIEAFETGVEVEKEIVDSLVDEVIADFLASGSYRYV